MQKQVLLIALCVASLTATAFAQERPFTMSAGGGPRLGVQVTPLTEELRTFFGAQADAGVLVGKVEPASAAASAGIRVGDVLVTVGGTVVGEAWDVRRALGEKKEGETVPVVVVRERKPITLAVRVPKSEPAPLAAPDGFDLPRGGVRMFRLDEVEKRLADIEQRLSKLEAR